MLNKRSWRRYKKKYRKSGLCAVIISAIALLLLLAAGVTAYICQQEEKKRQQVVETMLPELNLTVDLLENNPYSRPGISLKKVKGVVVHYTANPGTDAAANRNYFNNLPRINEKKEHKTYASSHFIIGMDGEIVQCIPTEEMSYASNDRNDDTISIECCHKNKNGRFSAETYQSLVKLTTYLCLKFDLKSEDVIRHYDVSGKNCPKYFVEHPEAWEKFLVDVEESIEKEK